MEPKSRQRHSDEGKTTLGFTRVSTKYGDQAKPKKTTDQAKVPAQGLRKLKNQRQKLGLEQFKAYLAIWQGTAVTDNMYKY